jgi:hypothetical protein
VAGLLFLLFTAPGAITSPTFVPLLLAGRFHLFPACVPPTVEPCR